MSKSLSKKKIKAQLINEVRKQYDGRIQLAERDVKLITAKYELKCMECTDLQNKLRFSKREVERLKSELNSVGDIIKMVSDLIPEATPVQVDELIVALKTKAESQNRLASVMDFCTGSIGKVFDL